jgi:hypothetical protein
MDPGLLALYDRVEERRLRPTAVDGEVEDDLHQGVVAEVPMVTGVSDAAPPIKDIKRRSVRRRPRRFQPAAQTKSRIPTQEKGLPSSANATLITSA